MTGADHFDMDIVGVLSGTDKASSSMFAWDYLRHFQAFFAPWRNARINLIEIGVQGGSSLEVWLAYFSRATIVGVDLNPACAALAGERVVIEIGSQDDPGFIHRVCREHPPTILIDDGSHQAHHVVYTFEQLFPVLEPGGLYIIEDLAFHFGEGAPQWAGDGSVSPQHYLGAMADALLAREPGPSQRWGSGRYIFNHVDSITFVGSAALIRKKEARDLTGALDFARAYMGEVACPPEAYARLSNYILYHHGPVDEAERYVRSALAAGEPTPFIHLALTNLLIRQERMEDALREAREACRRMPTHGDLWRRLAWIEEQFGNKDNAAAAAQKAAALG